MADEILGEYDFIVVGGMYFIEVNDVLPAETKSI